jgi:hypothetical protein
MPQPVSPAARTPSTLPAAAALVLLACLTIAAAWSATETSRAAEQVRRASETLVQLARLRAAIAEARVSPSVDESGKSPRRRARGAVRKLEELHQAGPSQPFDDLDRLIRERMAGRPGASPDREALLDREIARVVLERETENRMRLGDAGRRLKTRGIQTLFLVGVNGILAAGAAALAFRRSF